MNHIQRELSYIGKNFTESKLKESLNIISVNSIIGLEDKNEVANNNLDLTSLLESFSSTELAISNIVDLTVNISDNEERDSDTILA